ncbi:MAG: hypothetical protein H6Q08_2357 [Acidobacteria bacterium]|nr:hypothetical protein [Acidobacteriota bacterium]
MVNTPRRVRLTLILIVTVIATAASAAAQSMYYKEIRKDDRIYVFNNAQEAERFETTGEMGRSITRIGAGPNGETVVADSERALELFFFKYGISEPVPPPPPPPPPAQPWKISGLVFGDYYWFTSSHLDKWEGQNGFWLRRAYFTYDHRLTPKIATRFRLEVNSNGKLEGGILTPYVKDASVQWTYLGQHQVQVGIQPSATFNWLDGFWGLRHIEKTPADLYRIDSSRDFALSLEGPVILPAVRYVAQFGNESGSGSETDEYKAYRFEGRFETNPGVALEGFYAFFERPLGQDRTIAQVFGGLRTKNARAGAQYLWQQRRSGTSAPDTEIDIVSAFGVFDVVPEKATIFGRADWVDGNNMKTSDTGLPGADGIDYLPIDPRFDFTFVVVGFDWYLHRSLRFSPNIEFVTYGDGPAGVSVDNDVVPRLTFYWVW